MYQQITAFDCVRAIWDLDLAGLVKIHVWRNGVKEFYPMLHDALKTLMKDMIGSKSDDRPLALDDIKKVLAIPAAASYMRTSTDLKVSSQLGVARYSMLFYQFEKLFVVGGIIITKVDKYG